MTDPARPLGVGIIGCGKISRIYLENLRAFEATEVRAVADLDLERARATATEHGVAVGCSVEDLLADPAVEVVVNLTVPQAHHLVSRAALQAGKHLYSEKPLALDRSESRELLDLAEAAGLRIGCAPDTFLGGGIQTCLEAIDGGLIGRPVAAGGFMMSHGPESWHPSPAFFFRKGGGPLFDMGPYYLTALIALMGPIARVTASAAITFPERTVGSRPLAGTTIPVDTPTHVAGVLEFASGAIGTLTTSFDVWGARLPFLEIYGTHGSLSVPDPNTFGGSVALLEAGSKEWRDLPVTRPHASNSRGVGLADMAQALRAGTAHRASGDLGHHVVDVMQGLLDSAERRVHVEATSLCGRPAAMPLEGQRLRSAPSGA